MDLFMNHQPERIGELHWTPTAAGDYRIVYNRAGALPEAFTCRQP